MATLDFFIFQVSLVFGSMGLVMAFGLVHAVMKNESQVEAIKNLENKI